MPTSAAAKTHAKMIELTTFEFIVSSTFAHYFTSSISPGFQVLSNHGCSGP